jgi:hypothetical protein
MTRLALPVLFLILGACAAMPRDGGSPNYRLGFDEGCATANAESSAIARPAQRNIELYRDDTDYRSGWLSGHATCRLPEGPPRL